MELKHWIDGAGGITEIVLIVPSGIETKVVVCAFGDIKVLIVPSGIETG